VNTRSVFHLVSFVLTVIGMAMGLCLVVSHACGDSVLVQWGIGAASCLTLAVGLCLWLGTRGPIELTRRDGFSIATFGWVSAALLGSLPYLFSGVIADPVSAVFETMSGFTTTGASVLAGQEALPRGILFWRALTHFFGGMGVLVLCVAILPFLKVGGMQIYQAEMPGPSKDRLTPRITSTAKLLWGVYLLLCVVEAVLLRAGGLSWFDSWCHTFATMATGGFSTRTASVGAFDSAYVEIVIIVFMFLAGTNFALHFRFLRGQGFGYFRDPEFRFYVTLWICACLVVTFNIWGTVYSSFTEALRAGFFQGTSIMTTTGFCTKDFDLWPDASKVVLILLMFVGGCAGSTGGGMKNVRVLVAFKTIVREIYLFMRPEAVLKIKIGPSAMKESTVANICAFFLVFVLLFAGGSVVMSFFTPDLATALSSVIATLGNIGPGLGAVGATKIYAHIPSAGKVILTCFMLLGRLELYTVLVLLMPGFWRK